MDAISVTSRRSYWFIFALAAAAFGPGLAGGFVMDDFALALTDSTTRPLTWLSFAAVTQAGGSPALHHAFNILLHLASIRVAWHAFRLLLPERAAVVASGLFALHPAMAESVNYIWARSTLLMTLFCLFALLAWLRERRWTAAGAFALSLLSKAECAMFPIVLLLLRRERRDRLPLAVMLLSALVTGTAVAFIASTTQGSQAGAQSAYTPVEYLTAQGSAILRYVRLYVVPWGFTIDPAIARASWMWLGVAAVAVVGFLLRRQGGPWIVVGLLLLLPSSSVFPADDLAADRRLYLPAVAFAAAGGMLLRRLPQLAIIALMLVLAGLSLQRTLVWNEPVRLWREAADHSPNLVRPRIWLARLGPPEEARDHLRSAEKIVPDDPLIASEQGRVELEAGKYPEALVHFGRALALAPNSAQAMGNRGVALLLLGQKEAGLADLQQALTLDPCLQTARHNLLQMGLFVSPAPADCPPQPR